MSSTRTVPPASALAACCSPVTGSMIATAPPEGACACDMTEPIGLSQPTISHHMKILVEAGLVTREQRGRWAYYRVVREVLDSLAVALTPAPSAPAE